jgi:hypothetical protein
MNIGTEPTEVVFESLDLVYVPAADVDAATVLHVESLGPIERWIGGAILGVR